MEKPITLIIHETKQNIAAAVSQSNLPLFILESIFKDFYTEIYSLAKQQEEKEKSDYQKSLSDETGKEEK